MLLSYLVKRVNHRLIRHFSDKNGVKVARRVLLERFASFSIGLLAFIGLVFVWGLNFTSVWILSTSVLGVIGIAFFAGWSLLSNVFGAFVLFYSAPFKIGDHITVKDGDNSSSGEVVNMTLFFVFIQTADKSEVAVPNNFVLQRAVVRHAGPTVPSSEPPDHA